MHGTNPGDAPMNNSSFFTADRTTHLKIVVVSLLASIVVLVIGIAARPGADNVQVVYKPTHAVVATTDDHESVR
jgi:ABC-type proline/glycine betaine transport system permease subunit